MTFELRAEDLESMFHAASFPIPNEEIVFVGLRGSSPVNISGSEYNDVHIMVDKGIDYLHMRCTLIQWRPLDQSFAVFPGSTVPHLRSVRRAISRRGRGTNRLVTCFLGERATGDRRYYEGDHGLSSRLGPHRAFRNHSKLPVLRSADDEDYEGDDLLMYETVYDNIHCARQQNVSASSFSSQGCQVIAGAAGSRISSGRTTEQGPWRKFVLNAYEAAQSQFSYALFEEGEAIRTSTLGIENRSASVRFGSQGVLVQRLQNGLVNLGYDIGPAGVDGDLGYATLEALKAFQVNEFGSQDVDLIAGPNTAARLEIEWPESGTMFDELSAVLGPAGPMIEGRNRFASDSQATLENNSGFGTLTPGGFYSSDPYDLSVKRAIRTNNPGALNISSWQRRFPGFVGTTDPDRAGNVTTIYRTPEHGVAAWYHLLTNRYRYGENGTLVVGTLARRYAGVDRVNHRAAQAYINGWRRFSNRRLNADSRIHLASEDQVLLLARAMFAHEIGSNSPLKDEQIINAVRLKRSDTLPD